MTDDRQYTPNTESEQQVASHKSYSDLVGQVVGHYFVDQRLGGGATASVYRATDQILDRTVALKVLLPNADDTARLRFRREARTVSKLIHPHIVRTLQVGQLAEGGLSYIAMDLVDGESLASLLEHVRQLSLQDSARLLAPMAQALAYAHKEGVIHRDVKPSNILLRRVERNTPHSVYLASLHASYVPLLSDFGIARALDAPELTNIGRTIGTPAYMSPEQCAGSREVDGRADIYSLGAVLYRALVGRPPFTGTTTQILHAHVYEPLTIPEDIVNQLSPGALDILRRSLIKEPNQRYSQVELMANDLAAVAGIPGRAPTTTRLEAVPPPAYGSASPFSRPAHGERTTSQHTVLPTGAPDAFGSPAVDSSRVAPPRRGAAGTSVGSRVRVGWLFGGAISALLVILLLALASNLLSLGNGSSVDEQGASVNAADSATETALALSPPLAAANTPTPTAPAPATGNEGGTQSVGPPLAAPPGDSPGDPAESPDENVAGDPPTAESTATPVPTFTATATLAPTPTPNGTPEAPLRESLALALESYDARDWGDTLINAQLAERRADEYSALPGNERAQIQEMLFTASVGRAAQFNAVGNQPLAAALLREAVALRPNELLVTELLSATVSLAEAPALPPAASGEAPTDATEPDASAGSSDSESDAVGEGTNSPAEIIAERVARRRALHTAYVDYATSLAQDEAYCLAAEQMNTALALASDSDSDSVADGELQEANLTLAEQVTRYELRCNNGEQVASFDNLLDDMNGTLIYSTEEGNQSAYNIYTLPAEQNASSTLTVRNATMPAVSPNGRYVAFHSTAPGEVGVYSQVLADPTLGPDDRSYRFSDHQEDGRNGRITWDNTGRLFLMYTTVSTNNAAQIDRALIVNEETSQYQYFNTAIGKDPAWHPTLPQIVYSGDYGAQGQGLFLRPVTDGPRTGQLTTSVTDQRPDWTPDGRYVIFMRQVNSNWDLYRVEAENPQNLLRLTESAAQDGLPAVSPDGKLIAFASDRGGEWRIWVMSVDGEIEGGEARPLANIQGVLYNWLDHNIDWYKTP